MVVGPSRTRPRSRAPRLIAIVVVSVLVLLLVVDRGGELLAENLAASKLQSQQDLPGKPDVEIAGFPFLTQFASGEYDEVDVTSDNVPIGSGDTRLTLSRVRVDLDHMTVSDNFSRVHVERATAVATVSFAELGDTLGVDLTYVGDGKVRASKKITLFGQTITPTITARPQFAGGLLTFAATQANGLGPLAGELARITSEVFGVQIPLQGIPFQVRVDKVSITSEGLRLDLSGTDLNYTK